MIEVSRRSYQDDQLQSFTVAKDGIDKISVGVVLPGEDLNFTTEFEETIRVTSGELEINGEIYNSTTGAFVVNAGGEINIKVKKISTYTCVYR